MKVSITYIGTFFPA